MRFKYYLRGAGFGIIIATLIFMIAIHAKGGIYSNEKAIEYAKSLGYTIQEDHSEDEAVASADAVAETKEEENDSEDASADAKYTEEQLENSKQVAEDADSILDDESETEEDSAQTDTTATKTEEETEESTTIAKTGEKKTITIYSSDGSETVAARLYAAGLVSSASDYNAYLIENGYDRIIHTGTFEIEVGATNEEIAHIITGK